MNDNILIPGSQIIIDKTFEELDIHEKINNNLKNMNMLKMTPIQANCIPHLLEGKDVMAAAKTGSGKTLAFLVPLVHKVLMSDFEPRHGTAAIIISPTRELSLQIFEVLMKLVEDTGLRTGLIVGGNNRKLETRHLNQGVSIIVATPGRLLDHLNNTEFFVYHRLQTLVMDEADRLMDQGFFEEMKAIVGKLPKKRQSVLFSATLEITSGKLKSIMKNIEPGPSGKKISSEEKVLKLAYLSMKENCMCVDMSKVDLATMNPNLMNKAESSTVVQLSQGYIVCKSSDRFRFLYTFIRNNMKKKIMVFMSTGLEVRYYHDLLIFMKVPVLSLHGKQDQSKRFRNLENFKNSEAVVFLCTDVAARGLDIPHVDWVIQYDPPNDTKEYIHRVGRTARAGAVGQALLLLRPEETDFLNVLAKHKVPMTKMEFKESDLLDIQASLEKLVESYVMLQESAKEAFVTLVSAYNSFSMQCFDVNKLDLNALAKTFGLKAPPRVWLNISNKSTKKGQKRGVGDYEHHFVPSKQTKLDE